MKNVIPLRLLMVFVLVFIFFAGYSQTTGHVFYAKSLQLNSYGMLVLGSWAGANMLTGAYGWRNFNGEKKYFHQMNVLWNMVNLSIAGFAVWSGMHESFNDLSAAAMLSKHLKTENLYLINAGLDVGYMLGGAYLLQLSSKKPTKQALLAGYGKSVILQGAFLFIFDTGMYLIQRNHRLSFDAQLCYNGDFNLGLQYIF